jgi:hypothetical protein
LGCRCQLVGRYPLDMLDGSVSEYDRLRTSFEEEYYEFQCGCRCG